MHRVAIVFLFCVLAGCGPSPIDAVWCADHVEDVNAQFLAAAYGGGPVFVSGDTPLKMRLAAYFRNPSATPDGMTDAERRLADDACRAAKAHPLSSG